MQLEWASEKQIRSLVGITMQLTFHQTFHQTFRVCAWYCAGGFLEVCSIGLDYNIPCRCSWNMSVRQISGTVLCPEATIEFKPNGHAYLVTHALWN